MDMDRRKMHHADRWRTPRGSMSSDTARARARIYVGLMRLVRRLDNPDLDYDEFESAEMALNMLNNNEFSGAYKELRRIQDKEAQAIAKDILYHLM